MWLISGVTLRDGRLFLSCTGAPKYQGTLYWGTLSTSCHQQGIFREMCRCSDDEKH